MSEWLDLMLDEIARKKREEKEAQQELEQRQAGEDEGTADAPVEAQSK